MIPLLSKRESLNRLTDNLPAGSDKWMAMYSSVLGGITTDPAAMVIPLDDHMVHRGHAVFDTCNVFHGKAYGLTFHLNRFLRSAAAARITPHWNREQLRALVLATIAASQLTDDCAVRFWLSAGRGGFAISPSECLMSNFYCIVMKTAPRSGRSSGVEEATVRHFQVPLKPKLLANMKSNNYMLNALCSMAAEDRKGRLGIWVDEKDNIAEASIACVAFVGADGVMRCPSFNSILHGTTLGRTLDLAHLLKEKHVVADVLTQDISLDLAKKSTEVILFGGGYVTPVVRWDGAAVGTGKPGPVYDAIYDIVTADYSNPEHLDDIPYSDYLPPTSLVSVVSATYFSIHRLIRPAVPYLMRFTLSALRTSQLMLLLGAGSTLAGFCFAAGQTSFTTAMEGRLVAVSTAGPPVVVVESVQTKST